MGLAAGFLGQFAKSYPGGDRASGHRSKDLGQTNAGNPRLRTLARLRVLLDLSRIETNVSGSQQGPEFTNHAGQIPVLAGIEHEDGSLGEALVRETEHVDGIAERAFDISSERGVRLAPPVVPPTRTCT